MRQNARCVAAALVVMLAAGLGNRAMAGDLTPPAGPVGATLKTLDEVEPRIPLTPANAPTTANALRTINKPGSYYLTGDISGVPGRYGIEILVDDVTVDLMGYTIRGAAGSLDGVRTPAPVENVEIRNGIVHGWDGSGVRLFGDNHVVRDVKSILNGFRGIEVGSNSIAVNCIAVDNGNLGIIAAEFSVVDRCVSRGNGREGITASTGSIVRGSAAHGNTLAGIYAAGSASIVESSSAVANDGSGISVGSASRVIDCTSHSNTEIGIVATNGSLIEGCSIRSNTLGGISIGGDSYVLNNAIDGGASGIEITSTDVRVDGNQVTDSIVGIYAALAGNIIVRNTVAGTSTPFDIAAGNRGNFVSAPAGGAVLGASGGVQISADPWANFSY